MKLAGKQRINLASSDTTVGQRLSHRIEHQEIQQKLQVLEVILLSSILQLTLLIVLACSLHYLISTFHLVLI